MDPDFGPPVRELDQRPVGGIVRCVCGQARRLAWTCLHPGN